ncbi:MAG: hypothetical protein CM15mL4_2900 [uncultured marine virus]|nr:MAG: hypothetical protein CM15mL4_2900 [uncultured marine virus]
MINGVIVKQQMSLLIIEVIIGRPGKRRMGFRIQP